MFDDLFEPALFKAQKRLNKKFDKEGLTDEVLEAQVKLNTVRNTLNIHDMMEEVYEEYVQ